MKKIFLFLLIGAAVSVAWTNKKTSHDDWRFIAEKKVSFTIDKDVIALGDQRDQFSKLKLKVTDGPLKVHDMKVYFDNGTVQDVSLRSTIKAGEESRVIELDGGTRRLAKIEFWYETKGFIHGRSVVSVWGQ